MMTHQSSKTTPQHIADAITGRLINAIEKRGTASLVVCGGSSPVGVFTSLKNKDLAWESVCITLADDRQVPADDPHSNIRLVAEHLLTGTAASATFMPLQALDAKALMPFDVVLLGMGTDGHIASLFPDMLAEAEPFSLDTPPQILCSEARGTPCLPRLSMNLSMLINSEALFLLVKGSEKMAVIDAVMAAPDLAQNHYPVGKLLAQNRTSVHLCHID